MNTIMPRPAGIPTTGTTVLSEDPCLSVASTTDGIVRLRAALPVVGDHWRLNPDEARALSEAVADHADRALLNSLTPAELADCRHAAQATLRRVVCGTRARRSAADRFARAQITTHVGGRDGTEYVCMPIEAEDDIPSVLLAVANAWETANETALHRLTTR